MKSLVFLFPILFVGIVLEMLVRHIPNDYSVKFDSFKSESNELEVLLLGSSHTYRGVDPKFFSNKAINMANVSQTLDIDRMIFDWGFDQLPNLRVVIVEISHFSFFTELKNGKESWRIKNYNLYTDLRMDYSVKHNVELLNSPLKNNIKSLKNYFMLGETNVVCDENGFGGFTKSMPLKQLKKNGQSHAQRHNKDVKNFKKEYVQYLDEIILKCEKKNVPVLIYFPPAFETYANALDSVQLNMTIENVKKVVEKHTNAVFKNYLFASEFCPEDYKDSDHLNVKGAKKLSMLLNEKVVEILN